MLDHLGLDVTDYECSKPSTSAPPPLGIGLVMEPVQGIGGFGESGKPYFWIGHRDRPPQTGVHVAFAASSREEVDAFHAAVPAAGAIENGGPGVREIYHPNYYGAFVLDPDGKRRGGLSHAGLTPDGEQQLPGFRRPAALGSGPPCGTERPGSGSPSSLG